MEIINITAGVGFGHNLTLHIVDDSVTWYTAKEACQSEISGSDFSMCGYDCSVYTALKLDRLNWLTDQLVWIGRIKERDDKVYKSNKCKEDLSLTSIVNQIAGIEGQTKCIVLNTSFPTYSSGVFGIDDCHNKHPYLCYHKKSVSSAVRYNNVSLLFNSATYFETVDLPDETECDKQCQYWYRCVGFLFNLQNNSCQKIIDSSENFDALPVFNVYDDPDSFNFFEVKSGKRAFLEILQIANSRSNETSTVFSCIPTETTTDGVTTVTTKSLPTDITTDGVTTATTKSLPTETTTDGVTTVTTEMFSNQTSCECPCSNTLSEHTPLNRSDINEWIKNITNTLTLDKKQLSSFTRRLISANDSRSSSRAMGAVGGIVLAILVISVTAGDMYTLVSYFKKLAFKRKSDKMT
ncbi:uncharacterized protein LOC143062604 [Mytilus galloprovincialis]|uniref:uncharacterized protein LOC143062604 n=1 Tax=Mytilus galloprovincialis TaxID=29158 RepID=UPI003F7BC8E0